MRSTQILLIMATLAASPALAKDPPKKAPMAPGRAAEFDKKPAAPAPAPGRQQEMAKPVAPPPPAPPPPSGDVIQVDLGACVRKADCDLKGATPSKHKSVIGQKKPAYKVGEVIDVTFSAMPDTTSNWITIVPVGQEDNSWCSWQWAEGKTGTQQYGGLPKGAYEIRTYYNWTGYKGSGGGQCEVIGRHQFKVQ